MGSSGGVEGRSSASTLLLLFFFYDYDYYEGPSNMDCGAMFVKFRGSFVPRKRQLMASAQANLSACRNYLPRSRSSAMSFETRWLARLARRNPPATFPKLRGWCISQTRFRRRQVRRGVMRISLPSHFA